MSMWRIAYINANVPEAEFVTIQFYDFSALPYRRDWRERYASQMALDPKGTCTAGGTGNVYGPWRTIAGEAVTE